MRASIGIISVLAFCAGIVVAAEQKPAAKNPISQLVKDLKSEDSDVRAEAASALGKRGPAAKNAVQPLIAALSDKDDDVRDYAAERSA